MSRLMSGGGTRRFRAKIRVQGFELPRRGRRACCLCQQGKSTRLPDHPASQRDFLAERKAPGSANITTWGDVGLAGEWATRPIALYGRNTISGTYEYFREAALYGGDYKPSVKQEVGSEAVVENVGNDKFGIGYSGIGYRSAEVRVVPLAPYYGASCHDATSEQTLSGKYPIARYLYVYVNKKPNVVLDPLRAEFIKYVLSKDGQEQTERDGFFAITSEIRNSDLAKLGIATSP